MQDMTIRDTAAYAGVDQKTIQLLIRHGVLPASGQPNNLKVKLKDVEQWNKERQEMEAE